MISALAIMHVSPERFELQKMKKSWYVGLSGVLCILILSLSKKLSVGFTEGLSMKRIIFSIESFLMFSARHTSNSFLLAGSDWKYSVKSIITRYT
jgi:hypothetical protein